MRRRLASLFVMAALFAGCAVATPQPTPSALQPPPLPAAAKKNNEQLRTEVLKALGKTFPEVRWFDNRESEVVQRPDGSCGMTFKSRSDDDLYTATAQLLALPAVLDPILATHGYGKTSEPLYIEENGRVYVEATDPTGWKLELIAAGRSGILRLGGPIDCAGGGPN